MKFYGNFDDSSQISDSNLASKCRIRQFAGFDFSSMPPTIFNILLCGAAWNKLELKLGQS
eukprot:5228874-Amphidinium_carterae.1